MSAAVLEHAGTGLEFLRRMLAGETDNVPIGDMLGFRMVQADDGRVTVVGRPDKRVYNLIGTVHGGWTASILDTALGLSTLSTLDENSSFTTIDIRVNYLRGITHEVGEVMAEGRVLQRGRRLVYGEARLTDLEGRLFAHGTGTCLILPRQHR